MLMSEVHKQDKNVLMNMVTILYAKIDFRTLFNRIK